MARSIQATHSGFARQPAPRLAIGPLAEIGVIVLLVALSWFLIAS
ncbi:MAG TPA: hypothetical protein VI321_03675 [Burkholderiales bacterium]